MPLILSLGRRRQRISLVCPASPRLARAAAAEEEERGDEDRPFKCLEVEEMSGSLEKGQLRCILGNNC